MGLLVVSGSHILVKVSISYVSGIIDVSLSIITRKRVLKSETLQIRAKRNN